MLFEEPEVPKAFVDHYNALLGASFPTQAISNPNSLFTKKILSTKAASMICPITADEIKNALFSIGNVKAPGPDGYTSAFF